MILAKIDIPGFFSAILIRVAPRSKFHGLSAYFLRRGFLRYALLGFLLPVLLGGCEIIAAPIILPFKLAELGKMGFDCTAKAFKSNTKLTLNYSARTYSEEYYSAADEKAKIFVEGIFLGSGRGELVYDLIGKVAAGNTLTVGPLTVPQELYKERNIAITCNSNVCIFPSITAIWPDGSKVTEPTEISVDGSYGSQECGMILQGHRQITRYLKN